jgi:hypothetical protein
MSPESSLPYNGPLSTYAEWHSLAHGLYHGLVSLRPTPNAYPDNTDVNKEPHYYKIGFVLSTLGQAVFILALVGLFVA